MLKEIFRALKRHDVLGEMVAQVGEMLEAGKWMFQQAAEALMREADWSEMAGSLYGKDQQINRIEQKVRESIVKHLSVGHRPDISAGLALMSVVKDAERIGDYCKNIFEVARFYKREFTHPEYSDTLEDIRRKVLPLFDDARQAFVEADRDMAHRTLDAASDAHGRCDVLIRQLLSVHEQLAPDEAVAYVLLARFYKRVAAHLANIATSVVSPVPMIDYRARMPEEAT